jgi:hypothetical protein
MIRAVQIQRFRGIRECVADGFGRVNLIIGRNDCGKTAFMEALWVAEDLEDASRSLAGIQNIRLGRVGKLLDFDRFWRPLFYNLDGKAGLSLSVTHSDGTQDALQVRQGAVSQEFIVDPEVGRARGQDSPFDDADATVSPKWAIDLELMASGQAKTTQRLVATPTRLKFPPRSGKVGSAWISSSAKMGENEVRHVSEMKQLGTDGSLVELLREVDNRVSGIELLAPGGDVAELFVRLDHGTPMLPVALMGEGFQRCLELGAAAAVHDWPTLFIDEIENGMHHLVLEPLWRWIATMARRRNLQVFATTHSEECIHAASRAFQDLDDDGLRVIRLDRMEGETRAAIYDRALIATAERTGTEIRG